METGYFDKKNKPIMLNDYLMFENGSKYLVIKGESEFFLKCVTNSNIPLLRLSKTTVGQTFTTALIVK